MDKCPHCGGHLGRDPVEEELEKLREECSQQGFVASWDGWINPRAAAHLLNRSTDTLRGWRNIGKHLDLHRKIAGRNEYSLPAIAKWIVSNTEE